MAMLLSVTSMATMLVSGWMTVMYFVLRHPGYQWRAVIAALICLGAAALVTGRAAAPLRIPTAVWGAALAAFGAWALFAPGDDGWVIVAGLLFVAEGVLAVSASTRTPRAA
jgi:uncharacterized membrane protein